MKKIFFILYFVFAASCFAESQSIQKLDEYLGKMADAYHIPGMAVCVANPDEMLLEKSFGARRPGVEDFLSTARRFP